MPVQRKVFRIEEHARQHASEAVAPGGAGEDGAQRHREFMTELQSLRALIEPRHPMSRESLERARSQVAEAQAFKRELGLIYAAVERSTEDLKALIANGAEFEQAARPCRELAAIVSGTEQATQAILQAAEDIDQSANTLSAGLKNAAERGLAQDIRDRVVQIFESCNFQDLAGQRVNPDRGDAEIHRSAHGAAAGNLGRDRPV